MRTSHKSGSRGAGGSKASKHRYLRLLVERFPHVPIVSLALMEHNETLRELCEEYEACLKAVERFRDHEPDAVLLKEYSALLLRLEGELLHYVSEHRHGNDIP